jgi:hypothetical protein
LLQLLNPVVCCLLNLRKLQPRQISSLGLLVCIGCMTERALCSSSVTPTLKPALQGSYAHEKRCGRNAGLYLNWFQGKPPLCGSQHNIFFVGNNNMQEMTAGGES